MKQRITPLYLVTLLLLLLPQWMLAQDPQVVVMPTSLYGNDTQYSVGDTPVILYDSGGPNGGDVKNKAGKIVFSPEKSGKCIEVTIEEVKIGQNDNLYILKGAPYFSQYSTPRDADICKRYMGGQEVGSLPQAFRSDTKDGKLTVAMVTKSTPGEGFRIRVEAVDQPQRQVSEALVDLSEVVMPYIGEHKVIISSLQLKMEGQANVPSLQKVYYKLDASTPTSAIRAIYLYRLDVGRAYLKSSRDLIASTSTIAQEGTLELSEPILLDQDRHHFALVIDLAPEAPAGTSIDLVIPSIQTSTEAQVAVQTTSPKVLVIEDAYGLSTEAQLYNVSTPITLYDDGGKYRKITEGFVGQATFVPTTAGQVIRADFSKIDLFPLSSIGKADFIEIYNGREVKPEQLLVRLNQEKSYVVHSTAPDGSLTIRLTSDTGYPKEGFEAVISQVEAPAMTIDTLVARIPEVERANAGERGLRLLDFSVAMRGTQPVATLQGLSLSSQSDPQDISKIVLYYSPIVDDFTQAKEVGRWDFAQALTADLAEALALREGQNYFYLTADLKGEATKGHSVNISVDQLKTSLGVRTLPEGTATRPSPIQIVNNFILTLGQHHVKLYADAWGFSPEMKHRHSSDFNSDAGERRVTFEATSEGHVVQMDFTDWFFYYSSYGSKPTFKIYDGVTTSDSVLFELKPTKEAFTTKPEQPIRSTGKYMTVVFDGKGVYTSGKGWVAMVAQYEPKDMSVDSVVAQQVDHPFVAVGQQQVPLLSFDVITSGDRLPQSLSALIIDLKGCAAQIQRLHLYGANSEGTMASEALLTSEVAKESQEHAFDAELIKSQILREGVNRYFIVVDLREDAPTTEQLDLAIRSLQIAGKTIEVKNADPMGATPVVNIQYHPASGKHIEMTVHSPLKYYDEGGPEGPVVANPDGSSITFLPANPGEVVKITLDSVLIQYNSTFGIYSGRSYEDSSKQLTSGDNNQLKANGVYTFHSREADGSLTVYYRGKDKYKAGWSARVESIKPRSLFLTSATVTSLPIPSEGVLNGSAQPALKLDLVTEGEQGTLQLEELNMKISARGISRIELYTSGGHTDYSETTLLATATPEANQTDVILKLAEPQVLQLPRHQYYWLKVYLASDLEAGDQVSAQIQSVKISGAQTPIDSKPYEAMVRKGGLKGIYRIGASANAQYKTLVDAVTALQQEGVSGAVTLEIEPGNYVGCIALNEIAGVSSSNTITLVGLGKTADEVVISATGYDKPREYDDYYGVVTIRNTQYVTMRHLSVTTTDLTFPALIYVRQMSSYFTLEDCHMHTEYTDGAVYSKTISLVKVEAHNTPVRQSSHLTIRNNRFEGGYTGLQIGGTTIVAAPVGIDYQVVGNQFTDQGSKGIYLLRSSQVLIEGNKFSMKQLPKSDYKAIDGTLYRDGRILRNEINVEMSSPKTLMGIHVREVIDEQVLIANNAIRLSGGSKSSRGIYVGGSDKTPTRGLTIAFNTILHEGGSGSILLALSGIAAFERSQVSDNILQNREAKGGILFANKVTLPQAGLLFDRNAIHTTATEGLITGGSNQGDVNTWQATTGSRESKLVKVEFASSQVLYPKNVTDLPQGKPLMGVTLDLLGATRHADHPTVGAFEQDPNVTDEVPQVLAKSVVEVRHQSATISLETDQMASIQVLPVLHGTQPTLQQVEESEIFFSTFAHRAAQFDLINLEPETEYDVYGVLSGVLNGRHSSEPLLLYSFTTMHMPTQVATFELGNTTEEDNSSILSGTNRFVGVKVVDDFSRSKNRIAESTGTTLITVTNSKGKIPQRGFSIMADRTVYMRIDGGTRITIPATNYDWSYVDLSSHGDIREISLESRGKYWLDDYNGAPLEMSVYVDAPTVPMGQEVRLSAEVRRGVAPYTYQWSTGETTQSISVQPTQTTAYTVVVTDAQGARAETEAYVYVQTLQGGLAVATFEEVQLAEGKTFEQKKPFGSGTFFFANNYNKSYDSWSGFALSASTDTTYTGNYQTEQYNTIVGGGKDSKQFAIAYCPGDYPEWGTYNPVVTLMPMTGEGVEVAGMYVTNTAWVKSFVTKGDTNFGRPAFSDGSFFILEVTGDNGKKVECPLVDFRGGKRLIVEDWLWLDLSSLGRVTTLTFSILSSDSYAPSYFAMDNLHIQQGAQPTSQSPISIEVVKTESTSAQVRWASLPRQVSYQIETRKIDEESSAPVVSTIHAPQALRRMEYRDGYVYATLEGLQPASRYEVSVSAAITSNMQVVAQGKTILETPAVEGNLDARLHVDSLKAESLVFSFAQIQSMERYQIEVLESQAGVLNSVAIFELNEEGGILGTPSGALQASSVLVDGRIQISLQVLHPQTTYLIRIAAIQQDKHLLEATLAVSTPQISTLEDYSVGEASVRYTGRGIEVKNLIGASLRLFTLEGIELASFEITELIQLLPISLSEGSYVAVLLRNGETYTYKLNIG